MDKNKVASLVVAAAVGATAVVGAQQLKPVQPTRLLAVRYSSASAVVTLQREPGRISGVCRDSGLELGGQVIKTPETEALCKAVFALQPLAAAVK